MLIIQLKNKKYIGNFSGFSYFGEGAEGGHYPQLSNTAYFPNVNGIG